MTELITLPRATAQQALEALEAWKDAAPSQWTTFDEKAITALKAALEQPEQACNCRWVGDVQTQQCTLHEAHVDAIHEWAERAKAAEAKLAALEQQKPPPEAQTEAEKIAYCAGWWAAMEQKREQPEQETVPMPRSSGQAKAMLLIGERWLRDNAPHELEQPVQAEPVARMLEQQQARRNSTGIGEWDRLLLFCRPAEDPFVPKLNITPLYTHPPRREWRGLTEKEILPLYSMLPSSHAEMLEFASAFQSKLKEINT